MKKQTIFLVIFTAALALLGMSKGFQEKMHFKNSPHSPYNTWQNKYAKYENGKFIPYDGSSWWYLGIYKPSYKEAFPLSSTFLVMFTDKYHKWGSFRSTSVWLLILFGMGGLDFVYSKFKRNHNKPRWQHELKTVGVFVLYCFTVKQIFFQLAYTYSFLDFLI